MSNWSIKDNKGDLIPATADNMIKNFLSNPKQKPKTRAEEIETEQRYWSQLKVKVSCYYNGHNNIIKFL